MEQKYLVHRKELHSIICEHKDEKYVRLKSRITLNAGCKGNPELGLKIYPCGLEEDRDRFATIEADIYIFRKCPRWILESCVVSLMIQVIDCETEQNLNGDRTLTAECPLKERSFRIYQAIDHQSILQSTSSKLKIQAIAVLIFPPAPRAEDYELVQSPDKEFLEVTWKGDSLPPSELQEQVKSLHVSVHTQTLPSDLANDELLHSLVANPVTRSRLITMLQDDHKSHSFSIDMTSPRSQTRTQLARSLSLGNLRMTGALPPQSHSTSGTSDGTPFSSERREGRDRIESTGWYILVGRVLV